MNSGFRVTAVLASVTKKLQSAPEETKWSRAVQVQYNLLHLLATQTVNPTQTAGSNAQLNSKQSRNLSIIIFVTVLHSLPIIYSYTQRLEITKMILKINKMANV